MENCKGSCFLMSSLQVCFIYFEPFLKTFALNLKSHVSFHRILTSLHTMKSTSREHSKLLTLFTLTNVTGSRDVL